MEKCREEIVKDPWEKDPSPVEVSENAQRGCAAGGAGICPLTALVGAAVCGAADGAGVSAADMVCGVAEGASAVRGAIGSSTTPRMRSSGCGNT